MNTIQYIQIISLQKKKINNNAILQMIFTAVKITLD